MSIRKRVIVSVAAGLSISSFGIALVALGGWGPCGPASALARWGGVFCLDHFVLLCRLAPPIETLLGRVNSPVVNVAVMILVATFTWSIAAFLALTTYARIRRQRSGAS